MMRAAALEQRHLVEFASSDLVDLSWTPYRRIMLSARDSIWALVDAEDFAWLSEHVWNVSWGSRTPWQKYAKRNVGADRATLRQHREIIIRHDPRDEAFMASHPVDHGNGQTLDNRKVNLAWVSKADNVLNRHPRQSIPSLDSIVLQLLAELGPRPQSNEVPF